MAVDIPFFITTNPSDLVFCLKEKNATLFTFSLRYFTLFSVFISSGNDSNGSFPEDKYRLR